MERHNEGESSPVRPEMSETVKNAFRRLSEVVKSGDRVFVDENGDKRYLVLRNPAGNISVHNYETGHDYLLWEDGEIEGLSSSEPDKVVDSPSSETWETILNEIEALTPQELPEN
ncbi:hypothetical protein HYW17_05960 [Candidatus Uhrbacteria bacterium]|nr:hypothetical protein [Candidatus Uhrbacteria bacterium]